MYSNKLIACVKANGKVLREKGEQVFLPFGCEYTLWFKNEHERKVKINVEIDGTDVLFDKSLLLDAGDTMDLKGFVRDAGMSDDNRKFRFIEKTDQISEHRGDKIEDGIIKITYQFEKEKPQVDHIHHTTVHHHHHEDIHHYPRRPYWHTGYPVTCNTATRGGGEFRSKSVKSFGTTTKGIDTSGISPGAYATAFNASTLGGGVDGSASMEPLSLGVKDTSFNDAGITVEGAATNQSFEYGHIGTLESKVHTMIFQLKGLDANQKVTKPVTVTQKKNLSVVR